MKKAKKEKVKLPMSLTKKLVLLILGVAAIAIAVYLIYYFTYFVGYDRYKDFLSTYEYEQGTAYRALQDTDNKVPGFDLVAENDKLKLYTDTATGYVAVYDKRNGSITYSNPLNADEDEKANKSNKNYLKSQMMVYYYNQDVKQGSLDTYTQCVERNQLEVESIENGIRYIYTVGQKDVKEGAIAIYFEIPLEYRLEDDSLKVSIPSGAIKEYGGYIYRIQLLRYMGAGHKSEDGYMVVPNGSGSVINFNNGKLTAAAYSQYIYDIDPMVANYTTMENLDAARLPIFGICRKDRSLLVEVEDGATSAVITADIAGKYNDYNFAYPVFVFRNVDNLRNFGQSTLDVFVMEQDLYDMNATARYTFLTDEYSGYAGLANYYREKLIAKGILTAKEKDGDIPFYYDVIGGVKENAHFLGVQYLDTFAMTTYEDAAAMVDDFAAAGITNQIMNLQGWFNEGYYHDAPHDIRLVKDMGSKSELIDLNDKIKELGGTMYADVEFQRVTYADNGFNWSAEGSRYYGAGYVASFGLVNPANLRNTSGLGYMEPQYDLLSPKFLPRYVEKFVKKIEKYDISGLSLRDLGSFLTSDKRRTNVISREEALDVVLAQLDLIETTGKKLMLNAANAYAFGYTENIINVPLGDNAFALVDERIPLYQMILHGCIDYSTELLNFDDSEDMTLSVLQMIETGSAPHYVFTQEPSSRMKNTGMNRFYATTYDVWKDEAIDIYNRVNEALQYVSGAEIIGHEINGDVRKITYDNGVVIYVNYSDETESMDGKNIPAMSYEMEGI
ncbi:MAG: DUF5696 domain-containing protein [Lachnospiraceae bacterium]